LRQDQLEPVLGVGLAVVAGNPAVLVGSLRTQGMVQEESLARVGGNQPGGAP